MPTAATSINAAAPTDATHRADSIGLQFALPQELEAHEPPEARGIERDGVRLMVTSAGGATIEHTVFREILDVLRPGDVLVINTSGTLPAALAATDAAGTALRLHVSTRMQGGFWLVEPRTPDGAASRPFSDVTPGATLLMAGGGKVTLHTPYPARSSAASQPPRLWLASLDLPMPLLDHLAKYGAPIQYPYVRQQWPLSAYQTVYATEPGSAEMPSAGRAFTTTLLTRLVSSGVQIVPILLHTGVSSPERHEPPYAEWFRVSAPTARAINTARANGERIIAVGTTVVRALETVADSHGTVHPGEGWTEQVITPARGVRTVTGLLTGLHEPYASHLDMLEAIAGRAHLERAYRAALEQRYLWHEFGDLHLILP